MLHSFTLTPDESSMIREVRWEGHESEWYQSVSFSSTGTLWVTFHNGVTYSYENVHMNVYIALQSADSVGRAFNKLVKPYYNYRKLQNL